MDSFDAKAERGATPMINDHQGAAAVVALAPARVDVLVLDAHVEALAQRLCAVSAEGAPGWPVQVELAWHLRQRDTTRALHIADAAEELLAEAADAGTPGPADADPLARRRHLAARARLDLVRAEAAQHRAEFDRAAQLLEAALQRFDAADDDAGRCDAHWLASNLATDRGDGGARDAALQCAGHAAEACADPLRIALIDAVVASHAMFADAERAESVWGATMRAHLANADPVLIPWAQHFFTMLAFSRSDHARAIPGLRDSFDAALRTGQIKRAIMTAVNLGMAFSLLNDDISALDWARQSLERARAAGWPSSIGVSLIQTAIVLDKLDLPDTAQAMLSEAIGLLAPLNGSFNYLMALSTQGRIALKRGEPSAALRAYAELERRAGTAHRHSFFVSMSLGRARAFALMGRATAPGAAGALDAAEEAEAEARRALAFGREHADNQAQVDALQVLAELHADFALAPPPGLQAPTRSLHYLNRLFDVATGIDGFSVPDALLSMAAAQYAEAGDPAAAYRLALQASAARDASQGREARNRAAATQVRYETDRARADSEHHRQLAELEARRAATLEATLADLRAAQDELLRRNAVQARMNAERDQTLAFLAHDLRAPLGAIAALLPAAPDDPLLQQTARFAARALSMTDRFLEIARISRLSPATRVALDLATVLDDACETFARRAVVEHKRLEVDLQFGVGVLGHRDALLRAFCNLIDNALKCTPAGGRVGVTMHAESAEVSVTVADTGPGMPLDAQQVLQRTAAGPAPLPAGRLGLAIVAEVAQLHELRIEVGASAAGSEVTLVFRRASGAAG